MRKLDLVALPAPIDFSHGMWKERRHRRLVRFLTLNGTLLPKKLRKHTFLLQNKNFSGDQRSTFRYQDVVYYYEPTEEGYIAHRDTSRLLKETRLFYRLKKKFKICYKNVQEYYQEKLLVMTSELLWRTIYKNDTKNQNEYI